MDTMPGIYWRVTEPAVRRAMSLQDFNPSSATYGCVDRSFWQYRTIASFPAATMQQVALPFAVLFERAFAGNDWHGSAEMFERARAAMLFWARSQHGSGAVDEWYRHEHSYCATAFTAYGIAEACLLLGSRLAGADRDEILRAVGRAARWLGERFNPEVMNQNLAASAALWNAHLLTGDAKFAAAFERTWRRTLGHQHAEGWFVEYGGADTGYSLLALDVLAALDRRGAPDASASAAALARFVSSFVTGASDLGGRLGSRGTDHSFPYGAEAFAGTIADARAVAAHLRQAIAGHAVNDPTTVDDRYLAYFYLPSFVSASALTPRAEIEMAAADAGHPASITLPESGFRVWRRDHAAVVCSTRRNAAFNVYGSHPPVHRNFGYWIEGEDGARYASCAWSTEPRAQGDLAGGVRVEGTFVRVDDQLPLVRHEVAFRAAATWLFRYPSLAESFHRFIKRRKITRKVAGPVAFTRELSWGDEGLVVRDHFERRSAAHKLRAVTPAADVEVHSPSARQSGGAATDAIVVTRQTAESWAAAFNRDGQLALVSHYRPDASGRLQFAGIHEGSDPLTQPTRSEVS